MKFQILLVVALVAFTTCDFDFLDDDNGLLKEVRKGHKEFAKCLKQTVTQPDKDIKDLLTALKEEDTEEIGRLTLKLWEEGKGVAKCLKPKKDDENGVDWNQILKCLKGILGLIPCARAVITAVIAKSPAAIIKAIFVCPSGINGALRACIPGWWF